MSQHENTTGHQDACFIACLLPDSPAMIATLIFCRYAATPDREEYENIATE